jgi:uncharacterized DUF497 family protein
MALEIEFDEAKDQVNRSKHGVSLALGRLVIENEVACLQDEQTDYGEERWKSYGFVADRLFVCIYTIRLDICRVISVRPATRAERRAVSEGP